MKTANDRSMSANASDLKIQVEKEMQEISELRKELQRINSTRQMNNLKNSALAPNVPMNASGSEGFTLTHLLLVALLSMIVGAMSM